MGYCFDGIDYLRCCVQQYYGKMVVVGMVAILREDLASSAIS